MNHSLVCLNILDPRSKMLSENHQSRQLKHNYRISIFSNTPVYENFKEEVRSGAPGKTVIIIRAIACNHKLNTIQHLCFETLDLETIMG